MKKKTKILAVGDVHGDTKLIRKLATKAKKEKVDLVILAGDFTFFEDSTDNLIGPFTKVNKPVLLIPGNHETVATTNFLAEMYPNAQNIHGYSFKTKDVGIFGAGGADIGIEPRTETEIFKTLEKAHKGIRDSKKKVMVTHMHHKGSQTEFSGFKGSSGIKKALKKFHPDFLISAHIHEAGGLREKVGKTTVINVSQNPAIFEV